MMIPFVPSASSNRYPVTEYTTPPTGSDILIALFAFVLICVVALAGIVFFVNVMSTWTDSNETRTLVQVVGAEIKNWYRMARRIV